MRKLHLGFFGISFWLSLFSISLWAQNSSPSATLPSGSLHFSLEPQIGAARVDCTHQVEDELSHDWRVTCLNHRVFFVHAMVRRWQPDPTDPISYEIIYWVSRPDGIAPEPSIGNTSWVRFERESEMHSMLINQPVDGDSARLWMEIQPADSLR